MNRSLFAVNHCRFNFAQWVLVPYCVVMLLSVGTNRILADEAVAASRAELETTVIAEGEPPEPLDVNKTPEEAIKAMTLAPGFAATVFAAEPHIRQPNAFCIDDRGRLW